MSKDQFQAHDYYFLDEMLSDEHKLIRDSARAWVKKEVSNYRTILRKVRISKRNPKGFCVEFNNSQKNSEGFGKEFN